MNNPFFGAMGGGNGFMQMVQQFKQFKENFHGEAISKSDGISKV